MWIQWIVKRARHILVSSSVDLLMILSRLVVVKKRIFSHCEYVVKSRMFKDKAGGYKKGTLYRVG